MSDGTTRAQTEAEDHLQKISPEQLGEILAAHQRWLIGQGGQQADLRRADLSKVDLHGRVLIRANFEEANLGGANLQGASLHNAILKGADLFEANLLGTVLREADLQDADLTGVNGLLATQFAGANVSGAKLPEAIVKFEGLPIVDQASKNGRTLFMTMLLACAYSWLTIATTTDARLLTNSASSPLPILGTTIPIVGFYLVAPMLLLSVYVYFHLHMQRLWEGLADLPAVFPDGRPVDKRVYPWLLNGLVRAYFVRLKDNPPPLFHLQVGISVLLAWWVVPGTLLLFWARGLPRHDRILTAVHLVLLVTSVVLAMMFHRLAAATLRGDERKPLLWRTALRSRRTYIRAAAVLAILGLFFSLSFGAINGEGPIRWRPWSRNPIQRWIPQFFELVGYSAFANLTEVDVSTKPATWTGKAEGIPLVRGANLVRSNLRFAQAFRAFLVNADLRGADLEGANLVEADLRGANLHKANLRWAYVWRASLQGADLREANLFSTILVGANLQNADLQRVRFRYSDLRGGADFRGANLESADFESAKIQEADFSGANLRSARFRASPMGAKFVGADLSSADLREVSLREADVRGANLQDAKLEGTDLKDAKLQGANLVGAIGLTRQQIESAIIDDTTRLPGYLKRPKAK